MLYTGRWLARPRAPTSTGCCPCGGCARRDDCLAGLAGRPPRRAFCCRRLLRLPCSPPRLLPLARLLSA
eukprot:1754475-Alexandrium_andersonii.AAC.1